MVPSAFGNPRRMSNGFDYNRAVLLLAVLEKRGGLLLGNCDAYLNVIGGLSLDEPAADLAAILAMASSFRDRPVPADLTAIGEVGLTGELRSVSALGQRLSEVRRLGFTKCLIPKRTQGKLAVPEGWSSSGWATSGRPWPPCCERETAGTKLRHPWGLRGPGEAARTRVHWPSCW